MIKKEMKIDFIKWFSEISNKDVQIAGGKGASLGEMYNAKIPVPPGFVVTAQAYAYFIQKTGLAAEIKATLARMNVENTEQLNKASRAIRDLIENADLPRELEAEITESYEILSASKEPKGAHEILNKDEEKFVAVRSSATTEDLADASFAGQQETFLNVRGKKELIESVKKCMSSLFTARAIYYREKKGFQHDKSLLSVVIQLMINSEKSGVMFSQNPVSKDKNIVIEAVWGLGEGIVSGQIKPDHYVVSSDVENFEILETQISKKNIAIVRSKNGKSETISVPEDLKEQQVLNNYEIKILAQLAKQLEEHYKKPQDIEFAISKDGIFIVQSRPITTSFKVAEREVSGEVLLSGMGASPGIASGKVKIIRDISELEKVQPGDVLVTEMTNPDMVVSMQKAAAIITDEGGVTCFGGDTKVLTNKGFITIKEAAEIINAGGNLATLAYDCKNFVPVWKKVISAKGRKRFAMRISVSQKGTIKDNAIDITPDHKMIVFEKRNFIKKEINNILENNEYVSLLDSLPRIEKVNEEKKAYVLGALLSDGCIRIDKHTSGNPRRGRITFTQKPIESKELFIQTVQEYFEECFGDTFKEGREKISSSYLRGRLIQGYANDYICNNLEIAQHITRISQNLASWATRLDDSSCLSLLAGFIDGDGCFHENRLHIYADKENVLQGIIIACLNLGIFPQVTKNRTIYHIQILERISDILRFTKRVKGNITQKLQGNKLFAAKNILEDVIDNINYKGRIKPYVQNNLLLDSRRIQDYIIPMAEKKIAQELSNIVNSGLRMQRVIEIGECGEIEVFNLEIEAENELDHNFVVFTKKYTPLLVSNSHAAIVSREMGIPAVVGTGNATKKLRDGEIVTVDGNSGKVVKGKGETKLIHVEPIVPTRTEIKVIVDLPEAAERAALSKAKSIGLVRLEGIIAAGGKHPFYFVKKGSMENYVKLISKGIEKISLHFEQIWVRTSDLRSDEYFHLEGAPQQVEGNPMLGDHGVRFSLKHKDIMKAEILALKEVALKFPEKKFGIMVPQVISVSEVAGTKKLASECKIPQNVVVGIMVETPAAVQIIEDLCKEGINFISFGTNDLTQYTLAIDRNNESVQDIYTEMHPAVLRSISHVIQVCKKYKVKTSLCGQAGSREDMAAFLISEGIDSISVNADSARKISELVARLEEQKFDVPIEVVDTRREEKKEREKPAQIQHKKKNNAADMEEEILRALDENENEPDYSPSIKDEKQDIPVLNDTIPVSSESFADEDGKSDENGENVSALAKLFGGLSPFEVEEVVEAELTQEIVDDALKEKKKFR